MLDQGGTLSRQDEVALLEALAERVLWLSSWTIHHANHIRPNPGGVKVGGHQASSASCAQILTALYFRQLRRQDRVAVKPHASPVYHAIQSLIGRQSRENLTNYRSLGGAQAYPSRTKDDDDVDFSTGSVGLGAAMTVFASLAQDYVQQYGALAPEERGRMVAVVGDAELDEGSFEQCFACRRPLSAADMAAPEYRPGVRCPHCSAEQTPAQRERFAERWRQETLAARRGTRHVGAEQPRRREETP